LTYLVSTVTGFIIVLHRKKTGTKAVKFLLISTHR